jgi:hypothetical protein
LPRSYTLHDLRRCLSICAIVGFVLVSMNQGPQAFWSPPSTLGQLTRIALNFAVPFVVASVSAVLANRHRWMGIRA